MKDYYSQELRDYVEEWLEFDFEKGEVYWKKGGPRRPPLGALAGYWSHARGKRYRRVRLAGNLYMVHRLLYCFFHKDSFTGLLVDHINGDEGDNRIVNLRAATAEVNNRNAKLRKDNKTGYPGVFLNANGRYEARVKDNKKDIWLGSFDTFGEAKAARQAGEITYGY